jgi:hypothetical protein
VAGRALAFDDEALRKLLGEFVPVAGDDWYQRRRQDEEGAFFRKVADQGPRKGAGGSTRQGIYCLTASGELLAYKNASDPAVMRATLAQALRRWNALPADARRPGAVKVPGAGKADACYVRTPPEGGLVLRSFTRILDRGKGGFVCGRCESTGGDRAARDHVWLTRDEARALVPADARKGQRVEFPAAVAQRLLRFHLLDNTRGEPDSWRAEDVRRHELSWAVTSVTDAAVEMQLTGSALLATDAEPAKAKRGFDPALLGRLTYDRTTKAVTRLDLLAVGDHWGQSTYTSGARPGRQPLGIAFELTAATEPADRVPPQAAREVGRYLAPPR